MQLDGNWFVSPEHGAYCYLNNSTMVAWGNGKAHLDTIRKAYPTLNLGEFLYKYPPLVDGGVTLYEFSFKKVRMNSPEIVGNVSLSSLSKKVKKLQKRIELLEINGAGFADFADMQNMINEKFLDLFSAQKSINEVEDNKSIVDRIREVSTTAREES